MAADTRSSAWHTILPELKCAPKATRETLASFLSLATSGSIVHGEEKTFLTTLIGRVDLWVLYAAFHVHLKQREKHKQAF